VTTIESFHRASVPAVPVRPALVIPTTQMTTGIPIVTTIILIAMGLIFSAELAFGVDPWSGMFQSTVTTLMAFGGLQYWLVVEQGQWYRLLSAPLLHLDITHILLNGIVFWYAGRVLENMIGRLWFAAVFIVGGIGGGLMSLLINSHNLVSVGASGAIMAVLAANIVLAFHYDSGSQRSTMQQNALRLLIPSLIPLGVSHGASTIDYGAHFGGAIAGAIVAAVLLSIWRNCDSKPSLPRVAFAIVVMGLLATSYSTAAIAYTYPKYTLQRLLIPAAEIPQGSVAIAANAPELLKKYPRDPRARLYQAITLADANDLPAAEAQMRAGLAEKDILDVLMVHGSRAELQGFLALILADENRRGEAKEFARAGCMDPLINLNSILSKAGLCDIQVEDIKRAFAAAGK
jgi:rhomboid protease GluP